MSDAGFTALRVRLAAVACLAASVAVGCSSRKPAAAPSLVTVTATVTETPPPATVTRLITHVRTQPATAVTAPSPTHAPQGTVTETFLNDTGNSFNCSNTTLFVSNRSDTPILSITVTFKVVYDRIDKPEIVTPQQTLTEPAGIAAFNQGQVRFAVCVPPSSIPPAGTSADGVSAIPQNMTWAWET